VTGRQDIACRLLGEASDEIRVAGLIHAGAYEVVHPAKKTGRRRWLAVNPALGESSLAKLDPAGQERLFGTTHVSRLPFGDLAGRFARRRELLPLLCGLVFLAFVVEALSGAWASRRRVRRQPREEEEGAP
jgi:hypothetical protein